MRAHAVGAAFLLSVLVGCGGGKRDASGELIVAVSSDMAVPKDLSTVIVEIVREGDVEEPRRFELGPDHDTLPLTLAIKPRKPDPDEVLVRVSGWKGNALRVVREARTVVPTDRQALLSLSLQWLCNEQVQPGASVDAPSTAASSCDEGLTCVLGTCRRIAVASDGLPDWDPGLVYGGGTGPGTGSCLDMATCLADAELAMVRLDDCSVEPPQSGSGVNVALVLPPNRDGFCDGRRCLIPLDGFSVDLGWSEVDGRLALPAAVCERVDDGRLLGVVVSSRCPTKTVSIPICTWANDDGRRDAGVPPRRDAAPVAVPDAGITVDAPSQSAEDAGVPPPDTRAPTPTCATVAECRNGDGCCPSACNANNDGDCGPRCGNTVVEGSELCDGDCPSACPQQGCMLRKLQAPNTCQARCVADGQQTMCRNGDGCCPSGCTHTNDSDCACVPAAETCNGKDDNCNGQIDEDVKTRFYRDQDADGFGDPARTTDACSAPAGYVANKTDCNDGNAAVRPGATETCNGADDDCDGSADEGVLSTFYADGDGDGYGKATATKQACSAPAGYVANKTDCDDARKATYPGAPEICNAIDDDCDGAVDEGVRATFYADGDGDGYGRAAAPTQACTAPAGYVANASDCDDVRVGVHPGAVEVCNLLDDNCSGTIDEGCPATEVRYLPDNLATMAALHSACAPPTSYSDGCFAAARRWCVNNLSFAAGGYGMTEYDGASYSFVCLNLNIAREQYFSFGTLAAYHGACNDNAVAWTVPCAMAVDLACQALGFTGGLGPVEHAGDSFLGICVNRAVRVVAAAATLAAYGPGCTSAAAAMSAACGTAYHRYCITAGFASGFGPTSADDVNGIGFVCVPAY